MFVPSKYLLRKGREFPHTIHNVYITVMNITLVTNFVNIVRIHSAKYFGATFEFTLGN